MGSAASSTGQIFFGSTVRLASAFLAALSAILTISCGGSSPIVPKLSGNTQVTVVLSSTANDQLAQFGIGFTGITLTSQSGKTVTLLSEPEDSELWSEFIHVNGGAEPLVTVSVPQDIYTAATVSVAQSYFGCAALTSSGSLDTSFFGYGTNPGNAPQTTTTVTLAAPITITGTSMGLALDLQVAQSATYSACYDSNGNYTYSITPNFNLIPLTFAAQPTNASNGKVTQLNGEITAIGTSGGFTLALPVGPRTLSISTNAGTAYEGIGSSSALAEGTFVNLDGAIQPDGSLLATRVAVEDLSAIDMQTGPVLLVGGDPLNGETSSWTFNRESQGQDSIPSAWPYNVYNAAFQVTGQFSNLQSLPFVPVFNASNVVAGQNIYVSILKFSSPTDPYTPANTVTLMPQTINGTVTGSAASGNFTDYTVTLAAYDLFPALSVQQGQTTLLNNPGVVEVYVDNNTQKLNTQPLAAGSTLRFNGLIFNDNGTLRMDCAQVNDGVTASSQSDSVHSTAAGRSQIVRHENSGRRQQTTTVVTLR